MSRLKDLIDSEKSLMVKLRTSEVFFSELRRLSIKSVIRIPSFLNSPNILTESPLASLISVLAGAFDAFFPYFFILFPAYSPVSSSYLNSGSTYFGSSFFDYFFFMSLFDDEGYFCIFFTSFGSLTSLLSFTSETTGSFKAENSSSKLTPLSMTEKTFPISLLKIDFSILH